MVQAIIKQYDFNLRYAQALVHDLSDEQMLRNPGLGLENHPAFTLGHLIASGASILDDLGIKYDLPAGWHELFARTGPGDPRRPDQDVRKYPSKQILLSELEKIHDAVKERMTEHDALEEKREWRFSNDMLRLLDLVTFMCINHEAMHLGQLAAWRRAMGLHSALTLL